MKVLHTADTHFSNKVDKLAEVVGTTNFLLKQAYSKKPDVAIIAGDLVDEHDGPIRIDSEAARAAINFISEMANVCPVIIVRGTRSHDRETPYLFGPLAGKYPIHVASKIEMVSMLPNDTFVQFNEDIPCMADELRAVFTLIPSPDKSNLIAAFGGESVQSTTMKAKEALNDIMAFIGDANNHVAANVPRILVGHGMITGAQFSSGTVATGEDFEYCLSDISLSNTDLKAFGHIHKQQSFAGNVFYSGSPGRLNMGETEVKGFLIHSFEGRKLVSSDFIETPARRYALHECVWSDEDGVDGILAAAAICEDDCLGAEVRFRYSIPEERRHLINRDELTARFFAAGAKVVKIEPTIIPMVCQRAPGISLVETLPDKFKKYGQSSKIVIPVRVMSIVATMEGRDVEELIEDAKRFIASGVADLVVETEVAQEEALMEEVIAAPVPVEMAVAVGQGEAIQVAGEGGERFIHPAEFADSNDFDFVPDFPAEVATAKAETPPVRKARAAAKKAPDLHIPVEPPRDFTQLGLF